MFICNRCGTQFNSPCCPNCGLQHINLNQQQMPPNFAPPQQIQQPQFQQNRGNVCQRCGCPHIFVSNEQNMEVKNRGCLSWFLWILLAVCTCGIVLIIPLATNTKIKSNNRTVYICQNCGNKWH